MSVQRSIADKIGIKKGMRAIFLHADANALQDIAFQDIKVSQKLAGNFDYIHLFSKTQTDLDRQFQKSKKHLLNSGMLWVSWPKAGQLNTDLDIKSVIRIGYNHGLVESKSISINNTWSALKFTFPKERKIYNNSYGKLKQ
jgi:hypothetical protein